MSEITTLNATQAVSIFSDTAAFEQAQRMVAPLAKSTMVPAAYQNNIPNCMVALEMSNRLNRSVLMVMQNTDIIHGKPSLGSSFVISLINGSGLFSDALEFVFDNEDNPTTCYATTVRKSNGKVLRGTTITVAMAKDQGWWDKKGSKWPVMTGQMLMYRSAAFFGRVHCPDVLNGMQTIDEIIDIGYVDAGKDSASISKFNASVETEKNDFAENAAFEEIAEETPAANVEVVSPEIISDKPEPDPDDADFGSEEPAAPVVDPDNENFGEEDQKQSDDF